FYEIFAQEVAEFIQANQNEASLKEFLGPLSAALERLSDVTEHVIRAAASNPNEVGAASVDYLDLFGLTALAYMWAMMVKVAAPRAESDGSASDGADLVRPRYCHPRPQPKPLSLPERINPRSDDMMASAADHFYSAPPDVKALALE